MTDAADLVTCLCVTRGRPQRLRRAIGCFRRQTHAPRELLVLYEDDDAATAEVLAACPDDNIRGVVVPARPKQPLGALRNLAVAHARGAYVAQWDDDDWHAPARLAEQLAVLGGIGPARACVLLRWTFYDEIEQRAYLSARRAWEGSLVAVRAAMPAYPGLVRGEDSVLVDALYRRGELAVLDNPALYVYVVHGTNTWERSHWETRLRPHAEPMPDDLQAQVRRLLEETT